MSTGPSPSWITKYPATTPSRRLRSTFIQQTDRPAEGALLYIAPKTSQVMHAFSDVAEDLRICHSSSYSEERTFVGTVSVHIDDFIGYGQS